MILRRIILLTGAIISACILLPGCDGGKIPVLGDIEGPGEVEEYTTGAFSISVGDATGASFHWTCEPPDAGEFKFPNAPRAEFTPYDLDEHMPVTISVVVSTDQYGPVLKQKDVLLLNRYPLSWVRTWGGIGDHHTSKSDSRGIVMDEEGNVYVTGSFMNDPDNQPVDFDPGPGVDMHTSIELTDLYLCKYDANGYFQWARSWGGESWDFSHGTGLDSAGNVYVSGYFQDQIDLDPGPGVDNYTTGLSEEDSFLSKFDCDGNYLGSVVWGASWCFRMVISDSDIIFVSGWFDGVVDFDPGPGVEERDSENGSGYLCAFDATLNLVWVKTFGMKCRKIALGNNDDIYVCGDFKDTCDFDPGPGIDEHKAKSAFDAYVAKFTTSGDYLWTRTWGGFGSDVAVCIAVDSYGNSYVGGNFAVTVDFDPGEGKDKQTAPGGSDAYVSKFDPAGNHIFTLTWGGLGYDGCFAVRVDGSGFVYVTGRFIYGVDLDPGPAVDYHESPGEDCIFFSKFSPDGQYIWGNMRGVAGCSDAGYGIAVDDAGYAYITGVFSRQALIAKVPPDGGW